MKTDSWIGSAFWGRIGGSLLVLGAFLLQLFGVDFSAEDQATAYEAISGILAGVGMVLVIISKWREQLKAAKDRVQAEAGAQPAKAGSQAGSASAMLLTILLAGIVAFGGVLTLGCAGAKPYTAQIKDQGGTPIQVASAAYADALKWYNDAQAAFTERVKALPPAARNDPKVVRRMIQINDIFVRAGKVLDTWGLARDLTSLHVNEAAWKAAKDELIDAGLILFTE
jgi:hypothetical protein